MKENIVSKLLTSLETQRKVRLCQDHFTASYRDRKEGTVPDVWPLVGAPCTTLLLELVPYAEEGPGTRLPTGLGAGKKGMTTMRQTLPSANANRFPKYLTALPHHSTVSS